MIRRFFAFIVPASWKGRVLSAGEWDQSSLKVLNATSESVDIRAGAKDAP